jgi:hypothetical protein
LSLLVTSKFFLEAATGFEPVNSGFADRRLTTWLCRLWSGKRDLNPRLQPWQGCTLPLSYSRNFNDLSLQNSGFDVNREIPKPRLVKKKITQDGGLSFGVLGSSPGPPSPIFFPFFDS